MKQKSKVDGHARLFSKAGAQTAPATDLPNMCKNTDVLSPNFEFLRQREVYDNGSFLANHVVEANLSLRTSKSDSNPCLEINHLSTIEENWEVPESKFAEDMPSSFENLNQWVINSHGYSFPSNHIVEINSSLLTSTYDPHTWIGNNYPSAIHENYALSENKYDEVIPSSYENRNQMDINCYEYSLPTNHTVEVNSSLLKNQYDSLPWVESNRFSAIQENYELSGTKYDEAMPPSFENINQRENFSNEYSLPYNHAVEAVPSSDLLFWIENNCKASIQEAICMVPNNENDIWIRRNRLLALQQLGNNSHDQYSSNFSPLYSIDSTDETSPAMMHNLSDYREKQPERQSELENLQVKILESERNNPNCCETFHDKPSDKNERNVVKLPRYDVKSLMTLKSTTGFFDSHCHIDFLFSREHFYGTYADYIAQHKGSYPKSYNGCIAVFCKPFTFAKKHMWMKHLEQDNVWGAFGCHPKSARFYDDKIEKDLESALNHPKVRALGEIGLDYSIGDECSKLEQHYVFKRQLNIAKKRNLRLVIHCRDADDDAIKIMHEVLPKDTIFHLHCFTGTWKRAQIWMEEFPNVFIGITNLVTFPSAIETHEVAREIPLDRLLLETDAPYFVPHRVKRGTNASHPGMAIHVAAQIAALKNIPVETVLNWTSANTKLVYKIT